MEQKIDNQLKYCNMEKYIGGNEINNYNITIYQESEREFVVTHNANIKPVSYFTGRELELQELRQRIEEGRKSVLVSGMGGIGKTQICRELFNEYYNRQMKDKKGEFRHIGYIEYDGDMGSSLVKCLRYKEQADPKLNQEAAWKELEDLALKGKMLLFIDNVNKSMNEDTGFQRLNHIPGAVVITSRQVWFSDEFELYKIGLLDKEQCKKIYEKIRFENSGRKVKPEEVQDLEYIIENLAGKHTITVQLLANLARAKVWGVKKLKEELGIKGFKLQFHKNGKLINIQKSYEILYNLSGLTEAEQNILEAFSVFPYIPLAAETCNQWLLADAGVSEDDDILTGLYEKGWLQFDMEHESYSLHPVFAKFIYEKCKPGVEAHHGLIEACQKCLEIPGSGSAMECQKYIPFAENIIEKMDMEQICFIDILAYLLKYTGQYKKAELLYRKICRIKERTIGNETPNTAISYNDLAMVYEYQGKYIKAEEFYKKSLRIRKKTLGEENEYTAISYNNLAMVYKRQGKFKEAEALLEKSLCIFKKVLGGQNLYVDISYNNLAWVYESQKKYKEAEILFEKSLEIKKSIYGEEHPNTAIGYNNMAMVYCMQGEYKKAEELFGRSIKISERELGEGHPNTAINYNNLAEVYIYQGKYIIAEKFCKKSLCIREQLLGTEHQDTIISYSNLAYIYEKQGRYKEALCYYLRAYRIGVTNPDLNDLYVQVFYENLKMVYTKNNPEGDFEQWLEEEMRETE